MNKLVQDYYKSRPQNQQVILKSIRKLIITRVPNAEECLSYGVPAFKRGKSILMYGTYKNHVSIYPGPTIVEHFKPELQGYETSKGAIKFSLTKPIPYELIGKIIYHVFFG